jgi:predicted enzyme related to lactoylglutathione lyase
MLNLNSIMLGTDKPEEMADFYKEVFQKKPDMSEGGWNGWSVGSTFFSIGLHSEVTSEAKDPKRIIFNFETNEVKEEFERIKNINGAVVIKEPYEMGGAWITTLADPDGNYFQLMTPWDNMNEEPKK